MRRNSALPFQGSFSCSGHVERSPVSWSSTCSFAAPGPGPGVLAPSKGPRPYLQRIVKLPSPRLGTYYTGLHMVPSTHGSLPARTASQASSSPPVYSGRLLCSNMSKRADISNDCARAGNHDQINFHLSYLETGLPCRTFRATALF
jgi:hypothetical protein